MAHTLTDLERLDRMIAKGVTRARYGDKEYQFATTSDLLKARAAVKADLDKQAGKAGRFQLHHPTPRKGL